MKTLVIIDDEIFFRKAVCNFLSRQKEYKIIGEANNGSTGKEIIQNLKPDIAIVDISMPIMNGLEMINSLYLHCTTRFILLTGYADFEYAKQAISFGVKEYLLKPLDNQQLLMCLNRISEEINQELSKEYMIHDYFRIRDIYTHQTAQIFFHKAISGTCHPDEFTALKTQLELTKENSNLVFLIKIDEADSEFWDADSNFSLLHSIMENICTEVMSKVYPSVLYVNYSKLRQYMILNLDKDTFQPSSFITDCRHLQEILQKTAHVSVSIFSGTPHKEAQGIRQSYDEAISALHNQPAGSRNCFYYFSSNSPDTSLFKNPDTFQQLLILLRQKNKADLLNYLTEYFRKIQSQNLPIKHIWAIASGFLTVLDSFITECGQVGICFPPLQNAFDTYQDCENIDQLKQLITHVYFSVLDQFPKNEATEKNALISDICGFISEHYHNPDLRLETIASRFYVSPQYLSTLFSQEMNQTLTSYITEYRMQKAKELLLDQSPSVQNVATLCGFTDSGYFSKCFRKYYGISPKHFLLLAKQK